MASGAWKNPERLLTEWHTIHESFSFLAILPFPTDWLHLVPVLDLS
jgi:hypothetical protein